MKKNVINFFKTLITSNRLAKITLASVSINYSLSKQANLLCTLDINQIVILLSIKSIDQIVLFSNFKINTFFIVAQFDLMFLLVANQ